MILSTYRRHPLGCLILMLSDMAAPILENPGCDVLHSYDAINMYAAKGLALFKKRLNDNAGGAIVIWADALGGKGEARGGEPFYRFLKSRGQHVRRSKVVNNPTGSPRAALYFWYWRQPDRPTQRPAARTRRKAVVKKTKAPAH